MRKKNILLIFEKLMWFVVLMLPLLAYLVKPLGYSIGGSELSVALPTFASVMSEFGINNDNVIFTSMVELFGSTGIIHFFEDNSSLLLYLSYFITVEIVHLFVDFLVFIPRLAHKWMLVLTDDKEG